MTWSKVNGSLKSGSFAGDKNGALEIIKSTFNDTGDYMCTAVNALGRDEKTAKLTVEDKRNRSFSNVVVCFVAFVFFCFLFLFLLF